MFLSKHKNGYYYIYYYDKLSENRRSISTKSKLKYDALKFLSNFQRQLKERNECKIIPITIKDYSNKFLIYSALRHTYKTSKNFKTTFKLLLDYFGDIQLGELSSTKIEGYIGYRIKSSSIYAARRDLINLSSAFSKAVEDKYLLENPCKQIKKIKLPEKQPKFIIEEEYILLLNIIDDQKFKALIEVACNTGMRQMELITLEWEQVNFKDRYIILNNRNHLTKGKKIRSIPLNNHALCKLKELDTQKSSKYVFTMNGDKYKQDYVSKKFKKYVKKAKINQEINFHSLRHTFASRLVQKGISIYHVSKLLGHASISTTQIYACLRNEDLANAVNVLD